jgi:hypothetical protein
LAHPAGPRSSPCALLAAALLGGGRHASEDMLGIPWQAGGRKIARALFYVVYKLAMPASQLRRIKPRLER